MKKQNYALLSKFDREEKEKQDFQNACTHSFWSTRCGVCTKVLGSDHHMNFHLPRSFKKDNRVAILIIESGAEGELDLPRIQELKRLSQEYDELTVLVSTPSHLEAYSSLKYPARVNLTTLQKEIAHMRKYRKEDVKEINLILYPDTKQSEVEELERECKRLKIISKMMP